MHRVRQCVCSFCMSFSEKAQSYSSIDERSQLVISWLSADKKEEQTEVP